MSYGLSRQIKMVFILQALISTLLIAMGIVLLGMAVRHVILDQRMQAEAEQFWNQRAEDPEHPLPMTSALRGELEREGALDDGLRAHDPGTMQKAYRHLPHGLHWLPSKRLTVYVDRRPEGTLYLEMGAGDVEKAILLTGLASFLLAMLTIVVISWLSYRTSRRLVTPVSWLADMVSRWDPRAPDTDAISTSALPTDAGGEVRSLARALRGLAGRVEEFVARERDFTRDASHELRTPLTVVRVATDLMLADPATNPQSRRSLARIQRAGRDMEAVIEAFLILAREAEIEPQSEEFPVIDVVNHEVERILPLLNGRPVEVEVIDDGAPRLYAPPNVLNVMLGNLLSNAARFTESGRIEVRISPDRLDVRDTGIGMSEEALARVFDPFYRVDPDRDEGRGMGLSIVRRLGDRFGWPVALVSEPGEGTVATIHFSA
ncbi:sensor histidine kinase [Marilutibacter alkalisoli]|uniref:histidine kinase n=1 Tax=Marilutibacter alkalisoli TaxID=2591633 RepID=A0A514BTU7_9GAMM|nr:HAMP domain-containing sensor histidine kinase [Lysobacter alkalisoli]QDH70796.1 HAMP domain-containing histidine kinase [Lysobacter alkalisoli]